MRAPVWQRRDCGTTLRENKSNNFTSCAGPHCAPTEPDLGNQIWQHTIAKMRLAHASMSGRLTRLVLLLERSRRFLLGRRLRGKISPREAVFWISCSFYDALAGLE